MTNKIIHYNKIKHIKFEATQQHKIEEHVKIDLQAQIKIINKIKKRN